MHSVAVLQTLFLFKFVWCLIFEAIHTLLIIKLHKGVWLMLLIKLSKAQACLAVWSSTSKHTYTCETCFIKHMFDASCLIVSALFYFTSPIGRVKDSTLRSCSNIFGGGLHIIDSGFILLILLIMLIFNTRFHKSE